MQISTKPQPARKNIQAGMPKNISAEDRAKLESEWNEAARKREAAIALETRIPTVPSVTLSVQFRKFGRHWNAYVKDSRGRYVPLLPAPSIPTSAQDAAQDWVSSEMVKA